MAFDLRMRGLSKESRLLNPDFRDILCVFLEEGVDLVDATWLEENDN
jgi:hypothetical protein